MANIVRRPVLNEQGQRAGTSYISGDVDVHLPPAGRPEVYVGGETIDGGLLATALSDLVRLYADPKVHMLIMRACAGA
jgi:hypothetical protein